MWLANLNTINERKPVWQFIFMSYKINLLANIFDVGSCDPKIERVSYENWF